MSFETHIPSSIQRPPIPALRPFIQLLWASNQKEDKQTTEQRERLIPTASMHMVFRFSNEPIRIFKSIEDLKGDTFHRGVVGGIRAGFYVKDVASSACTVGACLQPGAAQILFGFKADELSERHTSLEDLWGRSAFTLWERLQDTVGLEARLQLLESFLWKRLPRVHAIHPAIAHALGRLPSTHDIGEIVEETGYSHRRFIQLFQRTVGLPPRLYTRLLRFQRALKGVSAKGNTRWVDLAFEAGYADQAHFNREFREFTGISPTEYLLTRKGDTHHVPIKGQFRSIPGISSEAK